MIAPSGRAGKRQDRYQCRWRVRCPPSVARGLTDSLVTFIILPKFEQARAKLECDKRNCCLRARSAFERRIPQPPAPRGLEWVGPENFARVVLQAGHVAGFFLEIDFGTGVVSAAKLFRQPSSVERGDGGAVHGA